MRFFYRPVGWLSSFVCCLSVVGLHAQTNFPIYSDQLNNGFQNWSWGAYDFSSTSPVHSGTYAISLSGAWNGISFWHQDFNPAPYTNLTFWANGGAAGGQIVQVYWQYNGSADSGPGYQLPPLPANRRPAPWYRSGM